MIDSGLLSPAVERIARRFRGHEQEHADALTTALTDLGGTPPSKPSGVKDVDKVVKGLGDVKSQAEVASFAIELETAAVAAYYDAHRKLVDAKLLQTGASIMANEGQHLVVLRQLVKQDPVPNAFETGKSVRPCGLPRSCAPTIASCKRSSQSSDNQGALNHHAKHRTRWNS